MRSIKVWLACAAVVLVAAASYGTIPHVLYGKRIAGQVVDADTGSPIARVHVAFLWESDITPRGFTAHNSRTVCYHAAATTTDLEGRFQIEPWREWSTYGVEPVDPIALAQLRAATTHRARWLRRRTAYEPPGRALCPEKVLRFGGRANRRDVGRNCESWLHVRWRESEESLSNVESDLRGGTIAWTWA